MQTAKSASSYKSLVCEPSVFETGMYPTSTGISCVL
jgi:hypothetical protein